MAIVAAGSVSALFVFIATSQTKPEDGSGFPLRIPTSLTSTPLSEGAMQFTALDTLAAARMYMLDRSSEYRTAQLQYSKKIRDDEHQQRTAERQLASDRFNMMLHTSRDIVLGLHREDEIHYPLLVYDDARTNLAVDEYCRDIIDNAERRILAWKSAFELDDKAIEHRVDAGADRFSLYIDLLDNYLARHERNDPMNSSNALYLAHVVVTDELTHLRERVLSAHKAAWTMERDALFSRATELKEANRSELVDGDPLLITLDQQFDAAFEAASTPSLLAGPWQFVRCIDGDTIEIRVGNSDMLDKVRLLDIDTPEHGQPGYDEARNAIFEILGGSEISLAFVEPGPPTRDKFGRILAYVSANGYNSSFEMIRRGWSSFVTTYGIGRYPEAMAFAERDAAANRRGLHN